MVTPTLGWTVLAAAAKYDEMLSPFLHTMDARVGIWGSSLTLTITLTITITLIGCQSWELGIEGTSMLLES